MEYSNLSNFYKIEIYSFELQPTWAFDTLNILMVESLLAMARTVPV